MQCHFFAIVLAITLLYRVQEHCKLSNSSRQKSLVLAPINSHQEPSPQLSLDVTTLCLFMLFSVGCHKLLKEDKMATASSVSPYTFVPHHYPITTSSYLKTMF